MRSWMTALLAGVVTAGGVAGQRRARDAFDHTQWNVPYRDGFTFVRLRYQEGFGGRFQRGNPGWAHDYPTAEHNFAKILNEVTLMHAREDGSNILMLDDPDLFRYPVAYLSEPGYWQMDEAELAGFRAYLGKGGFMIVDDFRGRSQWAQFESQVRLAFPELHLIRLDESHPLFNAFFHVDSLEQFRHPYGAPGPTEFWALFEDNDPARRMMLIANYNNDIGDYMEFSDSGWLPIALTNEAYKLAVNYLIYAMTR